MSLNTELVASELVLAVPSAFVHNLFAVMDMVAVALGGSYFENTCLCCCTMMVEDEMLAATLGSNAPGGRRNVEIALHMLEQTVLVQPEQPEHVACSRLQLAAAVVFQERGICSQNSISSSLAAQRVLCTSVV